MYSLQNPLTGFKCRTEKPQNLVLETSPRVANATTRVVGYKVRSGCGKEGGKKREEGQARTAGRCAHSAIHSHNVCARMRVYVCVSACVMRAAVCAALPDLGTAV